MSATHSAYGVVTLVPSSANERTRQILGMIEAYLRQGDDPVCKQFRDMSEPQRVRALIAINNEAAKIEGLVDSRGKEDKKSPPEKMFLVYKQFLSQWIKKGEKPVATPQFSTVSRAAPRAGHPKHRADTDMRQSLLRAQMQRTSAYNSAMPQVVRASSSS